MNAPDRVRLDDQKGGIVNAPALVALISAKEAEGVFTVTDISVRVAPGFKVLPTTGRIAVLNGPLTGTFQINQVRPNRQHTRYIATRIS